MSIHLVDAIEVRVVGSAIGARSIGTCDGTRLLIAIVDLGPMGSAGGVFASARRSFAPEEFAPECRSRSRLWRRFEWTGQWAAVDGCCRWPLPSIGYDERCFDKACRVPLSVRSKDYVHRSTDDKGDLCNIMSTS